MKLKSFLSLTLTLFSILCFAQGFLYEAQQQTQECEDAVNSLISLTHFDVGPYIQGSNVAVFFDPQGIFEINNEFHLELSNSSGDFDSGVEILSSKNEFFIPVLNGIIPTTVLPGTSYKLRVRSTNPEVILETDFFEIKANNSFDTTPGSITFLSNQYTDVGDFIKCVDLESNNYFLGYLNKGQNELTPSDPTNSTAGGIRLRYTGGNSNTATIRLLNGGIWEVLPTSG